MTETEKQEIIKFVYYIRTKIDDFYEYEVEEMIALFLKRINIPYSKDEIKNNF